ncbi:hypothetical protein JW916_14140 [Candidatus Sumerlaeota bacterium]|nr:hypothetical protein [Candidatus Sumerlaeota bacterium]
MSKQTRFFAICMALAIVCVASSGMGATFFVASTGDDSTGATWATAYQTLEAGVAAANAAGGADDILALAETHNPTTITAPISITEDLAIYGGCAGTEANAGERASTTARTVVEHTAVVLGANATVGTYGTANVIEIAGGLTVTLDQVDVRNGVARVTATSDQVGFPLAELPANIGAINAGTTVTLTMTNCAITDNTSIGTAQRGGGGALTMFKSGTLTMTDCRIADNVDLSQTGKGGACIRIEGDSFTLTDCVFENNGPPVGMGPYGGGGISAFQSLPPTQGGTFDGCTFIDNRGNNEAPVLLAPDTTTTLYTITDCTFTSNSGRDGGALEIANCYQDPVPYFGHDNAQGPTDITISGCTFTDNYAWLSDGGAIRKWGNNAGATTTISDCTFEGNTGYRRAAAIAWKEFDVLQISDCTFVANTALGAAEASVINFETSNKVGDGGSGLELTNCLFADNVLTGTSQTGVIDFGAGSSPGTNSGPIGKIVNCAFVGNQCGSTGAVVRQDTGGSGMSHFDIVNTVMSGNTFGAAAPVNVLDGTGRIANCVIDEGGAVVTGAGSVTQSNVSTAAALIGASGRVQSLASPCVDAGLDADTTVTIPATAIDGAARNDVPGTGSTLTDIGIYEAGGPIFVASTGNNTDGSSWTNAYTSVAGGLAAAVDGDALWVAAEIFDNPTDAPIDVTASVIISGGLDGNEASPADVEAQASSTRTTLAHLVVGGSTQGVLDIAADQVVVLDQVDVTSGVAMNGGPAFTSPAESGAGILGGGINAMGGADLTMTACDVTGILIASGTRGSVCGGGIVVREGGLLTMSGCRVADDIPLNTCNGGINVVGGTVNISDTVIDSVSVLTDRRVSAVNLHGCVGDNVLDGCTFSNLGNGNQPSRGASIKWVNNAMTAANSLTIVDTLFQNNSSARGTCMQMEGHPAATGGTPVTFDNCVFDQNAGSSSEALFRNWGNTTDTQITFTDCTFTDNVSGADLLTWKELEDIDWTNCTFSGNTYGANGMLHFEDADSKIGNDVTMTNCLFLGNTGTSALVQNRGGSLDLVNCTAVDNQIGADAQILDTFTLVPGAPPADIQVVNTVMSLNTISGTAPIVVAAAVTGRIANSVIDDAAVGGTVVTGATLTESNVDTSGDGYLVAATGAIGLGSSGCVDAGLDSDGTVAIPALDMLGTARTGTTDIGALEYSGADTLTSPVAALSYSTGPPLFPVGYNWNDGPTTGAVTVTNTGTAALYYSYDFSGTASYLPEFAGAHRSGGTSPLAGAATEDILVTWTPIINLDNGVARDVILQLTDNTVAGTTDSAVLGGTPIPVEVSVFRVE